MQTNQAPVQPVEPRALPEFFVGKQIVNERVKRYQGEKHKLLSADLDKRGFATKGETQSVWYTKEYIETILEEINNYGGDGLRIYFGEYENVNSPLVHPGQLCLLLVPTRLKADGVTHTDIILEHEDNYQRRYELREEKRRIEPQEMGFNVAAPNPPAHFYQEPYFPNND